MIIKTIVRGFYSGMNSALKDAQPEQLEQIRLGYWRSLDIGKDEREYYVKMTAKDGMKLKVRGLWGRWKDQVFPPLG